MENIIWREKTWIIREPFYAVIYFLKLTLRLRLIKCNRPYSVHHILPFLETFQKNI